MTPKFTDDQTRKEEFALLPVGEVPLVIDEVETTVSKSGNPMYIAYMMPLNLVGNYGRMQVYLLEMGQMVYVLLSLCEAAGINKNNLFPPELRSDMNDPHSFVDIVPEEPNLISKNLEGRVVVGIIKHETGKDGVVRGTIDINAKPHPFKQYVLNGKPYNQPPIITNLGAPPQQPQQQSIAPPPDDDDGIDDPANDMMID